jgi:acyl-homoserine lactone acylase PvdQ
MSKTSAVRLLAALPLLLPRPMRCGATRVEGLEAPARIRGGSLGHSHIMPTAPMTRFSRGGFNAARDRLWQIDL